MDTVNRKIASYVLASARKYPVIALMGPRQSGKTTLAKTLFPNKTYISLEDPDTRDFAINDPRAFLKQYPNGAIFDEIQRTPEILSYLQSIVDVDPAPGRFILTGSHQLMLHEAINQSLAGRVNLITLLPFSLSEIKAFNTDWTLDDYLYHGFYPRIYHDQLNPTEAYRNYVQTYIERDVRLLTNIKDLHVFERFLKLCAGRIGQVLNYDSLANDVGVSAKTIKSWLSILEISFIIKIVPTYFENFGKRVTKSPKLYFMDVGLASYFLDLHTTTQINRDPLRGALVENLVMLEIEKNYFNQGKISSLFYFRESNGAEIDFLIKKANQLIPIEVKSASTFNKNFLKHIHWLQRTLPERATQGYVVYDGQTMKLSDNIDVCNWLSLEDLFKELACE